MRFLLLCIVSVLTLVSCASDNEPNFNFSNDELEIVQNMPWNTAKIDSLEKAIYNVAYAIKIPYTEPQSKNPRNIYPNIIRYEDKESNNPRKIYLRFKLDRREVDFFYVNMMLKQYLTEAGGTMINGATFAKWKNYRRGQELTFLSRDKSIMYIIKLVHDKAPYKGINKHSKASIIITELGKNIDFVKDNFQFLKDNNITLAFCGDYPFSDSLSSIANRNGIETMLALPLESYKHGHRKSTKRELLVTNPVDKITIERKINQLRSSTPDIKGITHCFGDFASTEPEFMKTIIDYCKSNNLYYIDAMTAGKSLGYDIAIHNQVETSWALSYRKVRDSKVRDLLRLNKKPVIILSADSKNIISNITNIKKILTKKSYKVVYTSELLKSDLPKIK